MDLRLLKSVAKFVWRCSLGISILVMAFFCLDLAISFIFNGKQGTNENLADRMIEPGLWNQFHQLQLRLMFCRNSRSASCL